MKKNIVVMNFSGIYEEMEFWKGEQAAWLDVREISGTNCYCDEEAGRRLLERIKEFSPKGIHFIDSGNYHYMSRLWLEKTEEPFDLIVFDNHTDMQAPAFGGLLSCGGWAADAIAELPGLAKVFLIGPDEEAFSQIEPKIRERVCFCSREKLAEKRFSDGNITKELKRFFGNLSEGRARYLSIDKDVLRREDADTVWSQGDMSLSELLAAVKIIMEKSPDKILGADICGECEPGQAGSVKNDRANKELLALFTEKGATHEE